MQRILSLFLALTLFASPLCAQVIQGGGGSGGGGASSISAPLGSVAPSASVSVALPAPSIPAAYAFQITSATQYTVGDLVANSATAASVVPLSWPVADTNGTPVYLTSANVAYRNVTATPTGTTNGTTSITGVSSLTSVAVGESITSSTGDIPPGTYITAAVSTTITLSQAATGSNSGETLTIGAGVATTASWFRIHYFNSVPYVNTGDNLALSNAIGFSGYCGAMDVQLIYQGTDWSIGTAYPVGAPYVACAPLAGSKTVYALMEAKATFTGNTNGQFSVQPIRQ